MALTYGNPTRIGNAGRYVTVTQVTLDNSYPTGGYPVTASSLGLPDGLVDAILPAGVSQAAITATVIVQYNANTGNLQAFWSAAAGAQPTEVTAATNLSAFTFNLIAVGR